MLLNDRPLLRCRGRVCPAASYALALSHKMWMLEASGVYVHPGTMFFTVI